MTRRMIRVALLGAVAGAGSVLVAAGFGWIAPPEGRAGPPVAVQDQALPVGGEFELLDQTGRTRGWSDFRGRPVAVFFGFTHCPDICPTTLGELSVILADLDAEGGRGDDLQVLLVTGDPGRDTPDVMRAYVEAFDPRIVGLTGSDREIDRAFALFRAHRRIVPLENGTYTVDHSAGVYLYDAQGRFAGTLDRDEPAATRALKIGRLLNGGRSGSADASGHGANAPAR